MLEKGDTVQLVNGEGKPLPGYGTVYFVDTLEDPVAYWIDWDNAAPDWRVADELRKV